MSQKTKIIATLGPSSESDNIIEHLILAGVNVFRFNLKHNNYAWHGNSMNRVRKIAEKLKKNVALMSDLQGPELRTGTLPNNMERLILTKGQEVIMAAKIPSDKISWIPFDEVNSIKGIETGTNIYIDDGNVELEVLFTKPNYIKAIVQSGGELGNHKSVSIPNATIDVPTLMPKDIRDTKFSIEHGVEFIALSFVRNASDITTLRTLIKKGKGNQHIIAKIETLKSVENMDTIITAADAVMVARGDLGIEIPIERVPRIQKQLIHKCRLKFKPVIVATQMLQSMVHSTTPSRAEVADIANAVFDKTDALMLSEETATGDHPLKVATTMARIARYNEVHQFIDDLVYTPNSFEEIVIAASIKLSGQMPSGKNTIKGYLIFTESGKSARVLSRFRPLFPIYAFSANKLVIKQLALSFGVVAYHINLHKNPVINIKNAIEILKKERLIESGDSLIVVFGNNVGVPESNNTISIITA